MDMLNGHQKGRFATVEYRRKRHDEDFATIRLKELRDIEAEDLIDLIGERPVVFPDGAVHRCRTRWPSLQEWIASTYGIAELQKCFTVEYVFDSDPEISGHDPNDSTRKKIIEALSPKPKQALLPHKAAKTRQRAA